MEFVKKNVVLLACGTAALVFIVVTALGMIRTNVEDKMKERLADANRIKEFESHPINLEKIQAEKKKGEQFKKEFDATIEVAREINKREPLLAGVFPDPPKDAVKADFVREYRQAIARLPVTLIASGLPTPAEVAEEAENVRVLVEMEGDLKPEDGAAAKPKTETPILRVQGSEFQGNPRGRSPGGAGMMSDGAVGRPSMRGAPMGDGAMSFGGAANFQAPSAEPKYDPQFRALVSKARSIRCYADWRSFHISSMVNVNTPAPADMWKAQVGLWIQQDVVDAIAELNNAAAEQVREGDAFVEQMPVKRIERIVVNGYQLGENKFFPFESVHTEGQNDTMNPSFTAKASDEHFDVVRFTVTAYVDQRELLKLIDAICRRNFYKCLDLEYRKTDEQDAGSGYMYGTGPVVRARIDFEGYMARAQYIALMPKTVVEALGGKKEGG